MQQLHELGYIHKDLKPDNIVLNLKPLEVRLIDFDVSYTATSTRVGIIEGTPGYQPTRFNWVTGSRDWDYYSFVCMILEAENIPDMFLKVNSESQIKKVANDYCKQVSGCVHIKTLLQGVLLRTDKEKILNSEHIY